MSRPRRLGLRARVTISFAAGALALSACMAFSSYELTKGYLLTVRERTAVRAAYSDANVVNAGLATDRPDIVGLLRSLDTGGSRRAVLYRDGTWYARNAGTGLTESVPASLRAMVGGGQPGVQLIRTDAGAAMVVGIPLSSSTDFYVVDSVNELDRTLQVLALVLFGVGIATTGAGAAIGWYATRRVLRPLARVADAAQEITAGDFTARLDPAVEPELERLTTSFNQMVDQLSRRLERDRRFAADVSHELRSPLQTLAAAASVLTNNQARLDPRTATAAALIAAEIERFQRLVTDLLELAGDDQPPDLRPVNVADLTRQVCTTHGVTPELVRVDADDDTIWNVDRRRIERVVANLLDNADRHGGGTVAVRLGHSPGLRFLEVDDEGPGVNPRDRDGIFDRFVRGPAARARGGSDGTGLGLALVAQHVGAHGGRVLVTDRPGGGARFRVELPEGAPIPADGPCPEDTP